MNNYENKGALSLELNEYTLPVIEQITDGMPGGFFIYHADGNEELIYANTAMVNIFGCDNLDDFRNHINNSFRGLVHPDDIEQVNNSIHSQISKSSKGLDYVEYRIIRKDGVIRWIRDYGRFVHTHHYGDVFYVFVEDATERHLKEISDAHAVQAARERLDVLRQLEHETTALRMVNEFFSSSVWSIEFNELGEISLVNWSDEFRTMLGYKDETDFPNKLESWSDLIHEEDKPHVMGEFYSTINDFTGKKDYSAEFRQLTKDKGWRWFQAAGKLFRREDGTPATFIGIFVDITRQKLTDEAMASQRKLLDDALQQVQQAKKTRSIFLSNISHDFRTPMNSITGYTSLAHMCIDDKEQVLDYLNQISSAAIELQTLIDNLLNMSYIESGDINVNAIPCNLSEILWELEDSVRPEVQAKQLKFTIKSEGLVHRRVICDRQLMHQILINIVNNSLKFTSTGGEINVLLTELRGASEGYGFYTFKIQDTGIGMSKDFLNRISEPFEQEGEILFSNNQGIGLGIAITKNIAEKMGGTIHIESEVGKGTEFSLSIQFPLVE